MSPELKALVDRVAEAMNDAALHARTQNPDIPDDEYDAAQALAAIRCVAEATREASEGMKGAVQGTCPAVVAAHEWTAMHAASVLGEALNHG